MGTDGETIQAIKEYYETGSAIEWVGIEEIELSDEVVGMIGSCAWQLLESLGGTSQYSRYLELTKAIQDNEKFWLVVETGQLVISIELPELETHYLLIPPRHWKFRKSWR